MRIQFTKLHTSTKYLYWLIAIFAILLLTTYYQRVEMGDDAWFAEQSYLLLRDGYIHSDFFRGFLHWEDHIYTAHKGFIWVGAALMKLTGISLYGSKSISVIALLMLIFWLWQYTKNFKQHHQASFLFAVLVLLSNGLIAEFSFINRPELLMATLGFGSFHYLQQHTKGVILGAILAGSAMLLHLNGVIYLMAGGLWLLWQKQWKNAFIFGIVGGLTGSLYFVDVLINHHFEVWFHQLMNDPATRNTWGLANKIQIMLDFHHIFFLSDEEAPLSVLLISLCIYCRKKLSHYKKLLGYLVILIVCFWVITKSNFNFYQLLFVPFMVVLIAALLTEISPNKKQHLVWTGVLCMYMVFGLVKVWKLLVVNQNQLFLPEENAKIAKMIPPQSRVIAPLCFFYNQFPNYHLHGDVRFLYWYQYEYKGNEPVEAFFQIAYQQKTDYILFDYSGDHYPFFPKQDLEKGTTIGHYQKIFEDKRYVLYKLEKPFG